MPRTPRDIADHLVEIQARTRDKLWDLAASVPPVTEDPIVDVANVVRVQGEQLAAVTEVLLTVMAELQNLARSL
jgi:hypothetical protein